ncbi:hypothetical protein [Mycetocola miduiensis]|nr:hypothetical protein [Mycetocola miduiensis]
MDTRNRSPIVEWLLEGDPSVRWQVLRDLEHGPDAAVRSEREKIATSGWGARLLAEQGADGRWAGGLYSPKWTSTTYTLLLLLWLGLPRGNEQALAGCRVLWDGATFFGGGLTLAKTVKVPEACITGMLVLLAASFGYHDDRIEPAVEWLLDNQLADGGWNCAAIRTGSTHGSFHTSITVLEALHAYASAGGAVPVRSSLRDGRDFFLNHSLFRSHRSGKVVDTAFTRFPFPPQWHFDVLRGLEHFRLSGADRDARLDDAIHVLRNARGPDGRWPRHQPYPGRYWFTLEQPGQSRLATLRALRVLDWWKTDIRAGSFGS